MNRKVWDQIVSASAVLVAAAMIVLGGLAIYGGNFGRDNVQSRLEPEKVTFAPFDAMSPEEQQTIGEFAGQQVTTGPQAEAFARYIAGHLTGVNDGKTYAETSAAARAEGLDPDTAAELAGKADTLFKGETLRSIMLNAYGWWTVATIALYAGYAMVALGIVLGVLAILGFRHARRAEAARVAGTTDTKDAKDSTDAMERKVPATTTV
ncbi:MAG: hypothetical protein ACXWEG_03510 [Actinomycetota bacterium]